MTEKINKLPVTKGVISSKGLKASVGSAVIEYKEKVINLDTFGLTDRGVADGQMPPKNNLVNN